MNKIAISKSGKITCPKCQGKGRLVNSEVVIYCNMCDGERRIDWVDSIVKAKGDGYYSGFDKQTGRALLIAESELAKYDS